MTKKDKCTISRDGVVYVGFRNWSRVSADDDDWDRVLSEGLGTKFKVEWDRMPNSGRGVHFLRFGEPIYEFMRSRGLNPEWDGTLAGDMSITLVDTVGA